MTEKTTETQENIVQTEELSNQIPEKRMKDLMAYWDKYLPIEQRVLTLLIGLEGTRPHTVAEVAEELQVTTTRVMQIALKALHKPYRIHRRIPLRAILED
ncbi:MAG: hypothetical protein IJY28_09195 [Clostridia bacterium]|nr:hypothetical protein [Clostridia bacterium]